MKASAFFLAAVTAASMWQQVSRATNSAAATARGMAAYGRQQYGAAAAEFATAGRIAPTAENAFNLGTAQIAAGERTQGSATLAGAMTSPSLRAQALFNRGNSALAAGAFEHAVRDYTDALKIAPADAGAKRNLEIALQRQEAARQREQGGGGQDPQQQGSSPQPDRSDQQAPDHGPEDGGDTDPETLLRSIQQQEQEELGRMKRSRGDSRRIGW